MTRRIPLRYEPTLELWVAFAAWAMVLAGMILHVTRSVLLGPRPRS
ncbi:hypothetical protein GCM10009844_03910 [Nocardioides koreensis]|uniref:Uncharacterized protein n=1 Tax=Nocardioides koreensis TaxID=433651 RepID=A0ABN2Z5H3_9ACTN